MLNNKSLLLNLILFVSFIALISAFFIEYVLGHQPCNLCILERIPYLVAILVAIGMFRASGALELLLNSLSPILIYFGFPPENLPLALMRPLSGSGSLGLLTDLIEQYGPESLIAKIGATMFGSTETTFYVLAVYFGSVGIKKSRHALVAGLFADLVGIISAVFFCQLFFGSV